MYAKRLTREIDAMQRAVIARLTADYVETPPHTTIVYGADASPTAILTRAMNTMARRWLKRFDTLSVKLAAHFATSVRERNETVLAAEMRAAGFTVRFRPSQAMNDAYAAVVDENVGLIKSIGEQHLTNVRTAVMQSVQTGRDIGTLTKRLEDIGGVSRRRAARIALDQNNRATAVMANARYLSLGITRAKWLHSAGGKTPRPEHVAFSGQPYSIAEGRDFDNGEGIVWPGTAINCRCVSVPILD
jgi:SPP1 gp7 family putative phage head morphogenesis protein